MKIAALILVLIELISRCSITVTVTRNDPFEDDTFHYIREENVYVWHNMKTKSLNPHTRPVGSAESTLTQETALSILQEASEMVNTVLIYSGITVSDENPNALSFLTAYCACESEREPGNAIHPGRYPKDFYYTYFVPELGTEEKFDNWFLQTFTENALPVLKHHVDAIEYNGRMIGVNYYGKDVGIMQGDWKASRVLSLLQNDDGTATLHVDKYYAENDYQSNLTYRFVYSEEYGWRLDLEQDGLNWL